LASCFQINCRHLILFSHFPTRYRKTPSSEAFDSASSWNRNCCYFDFNLLRLMLIGLIILFIYYKRHLNFLLLSHSVHSNVLAFTFGLRVCCQCWCLFCHHFQFEGSWSTLASSLAMPHLTFALSNSWITLHHSIDFVFDTFTEYV